MEVFKMNIGIEGKDYFLQVKMWKKDKLQDQQNGQAK